MTTYEVELTDHQAWVFSRAWQRGLDTQTEAMDPAAYLQACLAIVAATEHNRYDRTPSQAASSRDCLHDGETVVDYALCSTLEWWTCLKCGLSETRNRYDGTPQDAR